MLRSGARGFSVRQCRTARFDGELMNPNLSRPVFFFGLRSAPRSHLLRAVVLFTLLSGLPFGVSAARAAPVASGAHIFLVRGVINIFSLGLDQIAAKLQRQGITATVQNHLLWASIADE